MVDSYEIHNIRSAKEKSDFVFEHLFGGVYKIIKDRIGMFDGEVEVFTEEDLVFLLNKSDTKTSIILGDEVVCNYDVTRFDMF